MENSKTAVAVYREKPHNFLIYLNFSLGLLSMENSMNVFVLASILFHAGTSLFLFITFLWLCYTEFCLGVS
jgi:hypothetical protein